MSTDADHESSLVELSVSLSDAARLLNDVPSCKKFTRTDRQNAVAVLARIFPEQLRAPAYSAVDPRARGGAEDEGCLGVSPERKYYEFDSVFIRRTLEPHEFMYNYNNELAVPPMIEARMMNDAAAIEFVSENTSIPSPKVLAAFHDNGRYYIIQELLPGIQLRQLQSEADRLVVMKELEGYVEILHNLKSKRMGGVSGLICPPYRVAFEDRVKDRMFRESEVEEFVFCHNDLSQQNVLVDPETLRITGIVDWEYSGFYPKEFEGKFYKRPGSSTALEGEENDVSKLLEILEKWAI